MKAKDYCNCEHARLHRRAGIVARLALLDGRKLSDLSDQERKAFNALHKAAVADLQASRANSDQLQCRACASVGTNDSRYPAHAPDCNWLEPQQTNGDK